MAESLFNTYKIPLVIETFDGITTIAMYALELRAKQDIYNPVSNEISSTLQKKFYITEEDSQNLNIEDKIIEIDSRDISDNPFTIEVIDRAYIQHTGYAILITKNATPLKAGLGF